MPRSLGIVLAFVALAGCGKKPNPVPVTQVADDDPAMTAAIEKARATVNTFLAAHKSPKAGQAGFSIKMPFVDGEHTEHMWLTPVTFDGKKFHGVVNNEPEKLKNVKIGDKASIEPAKISDWMFIENKKLVGGYTLRALRAAMPPAERAAMDKGLPFVIE